MNCFVEDLKSKKNQIKKYSMELLVTLSNRNSNSIENEDEKESANKIFIDIWGCKLSKHIVATYQTGQCPPEKRKERWDFF